MAADIVALSEQYSDLLKQQRIAKTPLEQVAVKLKMLEVETALRWSTMDFFTLT